MAQVKHLIIWTAKSQADLLGIYNYLCSVVEEPKAFEVIERIVNKVELLSTMPLLGAKEPLLAKLKREYRRLLEGHYKIVYNFRNDKIYVNRVFDSRQHPNKLKTR